MFNFKMRENQEPLFQYCVNTFFMNSCNTQVWCKEDLCNKMGMPRPQLNLTYSSHSVPDTRSNSVASGGSDCDTHSENERVVRDSLLNRQGIDISKMLPPIGVFWDIENCQVPKGKSATAVAQAIRDQFFDGYREADFVVVCDVTKEKSLVVKELNDAQVSLIHVAAQSKNAADEKLRQSLRKFADTYCAPAAVLLISGDINFAGDLNDLRYKKKMHVILLHHLNAASALILCANEHYSYSDLVANVPSRNATEDENLGCELIISNLPVLSKTKRVRARLKKLCENTSGKIGFVSGSVGSINFPSMAYASRARKRMDGEDVFGKKIVVSEPIQMEDWHRLARRNQKSQIDDLELSTEVNRKEKEDNTFQFKDFYSQKSVDSMENNLSVSQTLDPSFQQQLTKNMAPFYPNNFSNFNFPKISNIDNVKLIQNSTSQCSKPYLNNLETEMESVNDGDQKKVAVDSRKFNNNVFTAQMEGMNGRLKNAAANGENGVSPLDNTQLILAQAQQFQLLAQNAFAQRNMNSSVLTQQMASNQLNRANGSSGFPPGRFIRGAHGGNNNSFNSANKVLMCKEDDCETLMSCEPYFEPIQRPSECSSPVDLHVSGLDPHMDLMVTKNLLSSIFKMHVEVLSVSVFCLSDGSVVASVKVPSFQDAQYAISQLQRRRVGVRRITIAFQNSSRNQRQLLRSQVAQLLSEMPQNKTPLFRFTELFKSRFLNSVSVSELNKMKDICTITEEESGRMISANGRGQVNALTKQEKKEAAAPYCQIHSHKTLSDSEPPVLPTVNISLKVLTDRIHFLLESHGGKLYLQGLGDCYLDQFGPLPEDAGGVPLEHLVSCIPGIELTQGHGSFKCLVWSPKPSQSTEAPATEHAKCVSPMLVGTMSVFTRELLDLLKDTPKCLLPFSQFIPSYHRRYGRQCRVSDYGYTKLLDLLESLPHILQVMGNGSHKIVTLSHKAQVRRFTTDLLRVLKNQVNRQIDINDFAVQYEKIIGRTWDPCHYGLCELEDLLSCTPQSAVIVENKDGRTLISIPKREQTQEEIELTKKFSQEVVELLKRVPNCSMEFNKFVPAYHNQFGRQCRVSSYGCFKLIELFESIPDTVSIQEDSSRGEKYLVLTPAKKLQVFAERVCEILSAEGGSMLLLRLEFAYQFYQYESAVSPSDCECESFEEALSKIPDYVTLEESRKGLIVYLKNEIDPVMLVRRVRFILLHHEKLSVSQFVKAYAQQYGHKIDIETDAQKIPDAVKLVKKGGETFVQLTPLSIFANQMYMLLSDHNGRIPLFNFESAYLSKFKKSCMPTSFGFTALSSLLTAIPETATVQTSGYYTHKRIIALNMDLKNAGFPVPAYTNGSSSPSDSDSNSTGGPEKPLRSYDLWQSDSLFPSWNDLNGLIPDNITTPHPSELPLPSARLASPLQKMLQSESGGFRNEVEATSTTDENAPGHEADNSRACYSDEIMNKRLNRIAAHFENLM